MIHNSPILMRRAGWALLLASLALSASIVLKSPNESATLESLYTDSMRQIYSSWLFLRFGDAVFREPLGELAKRDLSRGAKTPWPQHPFIYPPGALVLFAPFGYAEYGLGLSARAVNTALVLLLVLLAHGSVVLFARSLEPPALLPAALYAAAALHWALNGFYDPVYVAAAVLGLAAARRGEPTRALFWIGLASFIHFRALFYLPVALDQLGEIVLRRPNLTRRRVLELATGVLLAGASAWAFLLTRGTLDDTAAINPVMEEDFGWGGVLVVLGVTLSTAAYFYRTGDRLVGLSVLWVGALDLALPFARAWHSLGIYPLLVLPRSAARRREAGLLWLLGMSGVAFRYFPSLRWLARGLGLF